MKRTMSQMTPNTSLRPLKNLLFAMIKKFYGLSPISERTECVRLFERFCKSCCTNNHPLCRITSILLQSIIDMSRTHGNNKILEQ